MIITLVHTSCVWIDSVSIQGKLLITVSGVQDNVHCQRKGRPYAYIPCLFCVHPNVY